MSNAINNNAMECNMPYPDNFNQSAFDRAFASSADETMPSESQSVHQAQRVYLKVLAAVAAAMIEERFTATAACLDTIMTELGEFLGGQVERETYALSEAGYSDNIHAVPDEYKDRPLHGLIESGVLKIDLAGYRPQLLGTAPEEAVMHLTERLHAGIRNARAQVIPILQGVFRNAPAEVDAARRRAATMDAQVAADALHSIIAIARARFEPEEKARLDAVDVAALTPLEVVSSSYFPQFSYFSNPYFGFPVRNGSLEEGEKRRPLALKVVENGATQVRQFERGLGTGTGHRVTYSIPLKLYERFECLVGLHATLGGTGSMAFRVLADGVAVFDSGLITGDSPAQKVSIPVWRVREIAIETQGRASAAPAKNYAVIAEPRLIKAQAPPKVDQDKTP